MMTTGEKVIWAAAFGTQITEFGDLRSAVDHAFHVVMDARQATHGVVENVRPEAFAMLHEMLEPDAKESAQAATLKAIRTHLVGIECMSAHDYGRLEEVSLPTANVDDLRKWFERLLVLVGAKS